MLHFEKSVTLSKMCSDSWLETAKQVITQGPKLSGAPNSNLVQAPLNSKIVYIKTSLYITRSSNYIPIDIVRTGFRWCAPLGDLSYLMFVTNCFNNVLVVLLLFINSLLSLSVYDFTIICAYAQWWFCSWFFIIRSVFEDWKYVVWYHVLRGGGGGVWRVWWTFKKHWMLLFTVSARCSHCHITLQF